MVGMRRASIFATACAALALSLGGSPASAQGRGGDSGDLSIELIDPRTVAPLDIDTIRRSVAKTGRLLVVDETFAPYGIGAEIAAQMADQGFDDLDAPIRRLSCAASFSSRNRRAEMAPTCSSVNGSARGSGAGVATVAGGRDPSGCSASQ